MVTVEKMAKVVSEINRGLASSGPLGVRRRFTGPFPLVFGYYQATCKCRHQCYGSKKIDMTLCVKLPVTVNFGSASSS